MNVFLLSASIFFYLVVFAHQFASLLRHWRCPRVAEITMALLAIFTQACLLHHWIDVGSAQNLTLFNMLALVVWMVAVLAWILNLFQSLGLFWLVIAPLAVLSMLVRAFFPATYCVNIGQDPVSLVHILLAVVLVGVLVLAAVSAVVLRLQQYSIKHLHESRWLARLPAIESMERLLSQLLMLGFVLLSVILALSLYFYSSLMHFDGLLWQKSIAVIASWLIFAVVLIGRLAFGWRGVRSVVATFVAMLILLVVYLYS